MARADVLTHFHRDDQATVKSVLNDLVKAGMVFTKGTHEAVAYRAASPEEYDLKNFSCYSATRQPIRSVTTTMSS